MIVRSGDELSHVTQQAATATYALFVGDALTTFDASQLRVLDFGALHTRRLRVKASIIGASHFLTVEGGSGQPLFTELLGCVDLKDLDYHPSYTLRPQPGRAEIAHRDRTLAVSMTLGYGETEPNRRDLLDVFSTRDPATLRLEFTFPGPLHPRTAVGVTVAGDEVHVETIHEYASAEGVVETLETTTDLRLLT